MRHLAIGGLVSLALTLATAVLSAWPSWQSLPEDSALIRVSFSVSGARNCRDRTAEELAALPRNMRRKRVCERRRSPVRLSIGIDGATLFDAAIPPGGLSGTGPSRVYRRFEVPAGDHRITLRLQTDPAAPDKAVTAVHEVTLDPGQNMAIDFDTTTGSFVLY
ncbi:MAG: hypothetical protein D6754_10000 [Alphaproteobacteria bacterium]|nr:MAG: hypothetical protein D6754_10000 [Alphaproteobacteria bacterium]